MSVSLILEEVMTNELFSFSQNFSKSTSLQAKTKVFPFIIYAGPPSCRVLCVGKDHQC